MVRALYYEKVDGDKVRCTLCPHFCTIAHGKRGLCKVRFNDEGELYSCSYGQISAINIDPIEKKPLYHFMPKTKTFSISSYGCNMKCQFCQNYEISQDVKETSEVSPKQVVETAIAHGCPSVSYTYNEPTVFYEFMLETAKIAKSKNIKNILITNGMINKAPLEELSPFIDAMNIDLKAYNANSYKTLGGDLAAVKSTIEFSAKKCHIELTFLAVTNFNCDMVEFSQMIDYIAGIDINIPLHISRFFPCYKYNEAPTSVDVLKKMHEVAKTKLKNVYLGNLKEG